MVGTETETFVVRAGPRRILFFVLLTAVLLVVELHIARNFLIDGHREPILGLVWWPLALLLIGVTILWPFIASTLAMRIEVGATTLKLRIPRYEGIPGLRWIRREIPYSEIKAVERRDEIIRIGSLTTIQTVTAIQTVYSIVAANGQRIVLGCTSPLTRWNYPFEDAAKRVAAKSNLAVADRGCVRLRGLLSTMLRGAPSWETASVGDDERAAAQRATPRVWRLAFFTLLVLAAVWVLNWLQG